MEEQVTKVAWTNSSGRVLATVNCESLQEVRIQMLEWLEDFEAGDTVTTLEIG